MASKNKEHREAITLKLQELQTGKLLNGQQLTEIIATQNLNEQDKQNLMLLLGINEAKLKETALDALTITNNLNEAVSQGLINEEQKEHILQYVSEIALTNSQTTANLGLAGSFKALMASMGPIGWISLIASVALPVIMQLVGDMKSAQEQLQESVSALKEAKSELETVNDELETTKEQISELEAKPNLTFTDVSELKRLKAENAERERKIQLLKDEIKYQSNVTVNNAKKASLGVEGGVKGFLKAFAGDYGELTDDVYKSNIASITEEAQAAIALAKANVSNAENTEQLAEAEAKLTKEYSSFLSKVQNGQEILDSFTEAGYVYGTDDETDAIIDSLYEMSDAYMVVTGSIGTFWNQMGSRDKYADGYEAIMELANAGNLTADSLLELYNQTGETNQGVKSLIDYMLSLGMIDWSAVLGKDFNSVAGEDKIVDTSEAIKWMGKSTDNTTKVMSLFATELNKVEEAAESATSAVKSFTDIISPIEDAYDAIEDASKDMKEYGFLSADSVKAMEKSGLTEYLEQTESGYKLTNNALKDYLDNQGAVYQTAVDNAKTSAEGLIDKQAMLAAGYKDTAAGLATYLRALAQADLVESSRDYKKAYRKKYPNSILSDYEIDEAYMWSQESFDATDRYYEMINAANAIDAAIKNQQTFNAVTSTLDRDNQNNLDKGTDTFKEDVEAQIDKIKLDFEAGIITEKQYRDKLEGIINKYYKDKPKYLAEFTKYLKEVNEYDKKVLEKTLDDSTEALQTGKTTNLDSFIKTNVNRINSAKKAGDVNEDEAEELMFGVGNDALEELERRLDMGIISEKEYYALLKKYNEDFYKQGLINYETYNSNKKKLYDNDKNLIKAEFDTLKYWLNMGIISEDEYYDRLMKKADTYYKAGKITLDEYRSYKEDFYNWDKEKQDDLVKTQFDKLKHQQSLGLKSEEQYLIGLYQLNEKYYAMKENKLSSLSMQFPVDIINLVKY